MDVLLHNLIVCEYKTYSERKKLYADTGTRTNVVVSCHDVLTRSATSGYSKQPPFRNIHPWKQS